MALSESTIDQRCSEPGMFPHLSAIVTTARKVSPADFLAEPMDTLTIQDGSYISWEGC